MASGLSRLVRDLRRRRVFRATGLYIVAGWVVVQVADVLFQTFAIQDAYLRYVFLGLLLGYPVAMFFVWRYEIGEDGITRTRPLGDNGNGGPAVALTRSDYLIISALVTVGVLIALGTFSRVADLPIPYVGGGAPTNSVAVLPFENQSDDTNNAYFSDGVAEEIVNRLSKLDELIVPGRRLSFQYRDQSLGVNEIARHLDVQHVVTGSVRKSENAVRISAQLVGASDGHEIWAQTYDRGLDDIFEVQDEIANKISVELARVLEIETPMPIASSMPTTNMEAWDLYLRGQERFHLRDEAALRQSIDLYEQAIALDPGFALAHSALATAHAVLPEYSDADQTSEYAIAKEHATRATVLDPDLATPHATLAYMSMRTWDWPEGGSQFSKALELEDRDATIHQWYSNYLNDVLYREQALEHAQMAATFESASPVVNVVLALNYLLTGDKNNELVVHHSDVAREKDYRGLLGEYMKFAVMLRQGRSQEAVTQLEAVHRNAGRTPSDWIAAYADGFDNDAGQAAAVTALENARSAGLLNDGDLFYFYSLLGAADPFYELAAEHVEDRRIPHVWTLLPEAAPIRSDPRYSPLLNDLGLIEFWNLHGWPPLCRPDGNAARCD